MKQRTPLRRLTPLPRPSKPIKRVNGKRRAKNQERAYGSRERREWLHRLPCCITGDAPQWGVKIDAVHVKGGGAGRKADASLVVPMSATLHREMHRIGQKSFEAKYKVDLLAQAAFYDRAWRKAQDEHEREAK